HALRLAGRARCVEDEQRILGVHFLARTVGRHGLGDVVIEHVAPGLHIHWSISALDHDDAGHAAGLVAGGVDIGLERNLAAAAEAFVGGDHAGGFAVFDAPG